MVVVWTDDAKRDLKGIFDYYKHEAGATVARKISCHIEESASSLARMPLMAPRELLLEDRPEGFRALVVRRRYKVVYFVGEGVVNVVAVWDCRQSPGRLRSFFPWRRN